jgi:hypothetical protein
MQEGWLKREVYMWLLLFLSVSPRDGRIARPSRLTPQASRTTDFESCACVAERIIGYCGMPRRNYSSG